jgi:hypothetical protein
MNISQDVPSDPPTPRNLIQSCTTCLIHLICVQHALMPSDTCSMPPKYFNALCTLMHYIIPLQPLPPCLGYLWGHSTHLPHIVTTCVGPTHCAPCHVFPFLDFVQCLHDLGDIRTTRRALCFDILDCACFILHHFSFTSTDFVLYHLPYVFLMFASWLMSYLGTFSF